MVTRLAGLGTGAALLLCVTLTGCIGATPLPKRTRTPEGTEVKDVDLTFIHPGQTTRAEVREKLKLLDTGFWMRMADSNRMRTRRCSSRSAVLA
jgi:hypothetical protein